MISVMYFIVIQMDDYVFIDSKHENLLQHYPTMQQQQTPFGTTAAEDVTSSIVFFW